MEVFQNERMALNNDLYEEQAKQTALNVFYSFFGLKSVDDVMMNLSPMVHWQGTKDYMVAHDKKEAETLLRREIEKVPGECVLKIVSADSFTVMAGCFNVSGEVELRVSESNMLRYITIYFSFTVVREDDVISIVSAHTTVRDNAVVATHRKKRSGESVKRLAKDLSEMAQRDKVTGLYTLDAFKKAAKERLDYDQSSYAMICTGITHFERINNLYGIKKADDALLLTGNILTTSGRNVVLCARSSADHFLALVKYEIKDQLELFVDNLRDRFLTEVAASYQEAVPELGIGVCMVDKGDADVEKIIDSANLARKSLGMSVDKHVIYFDSEIYAEIERIRKIEKEMKDALLNGEFKVFFQPKYALAKTPEIVGAEALCRWIKPDGKMVYPDEFIPVFEQNGFIAEVDFYMLGKVCEMIERRLKSGQKCVPISINQSRVLLQDPKYVQRVAKILTRYNVPPKYIELELTERIFTGDSKNLAEMMQQLKDLGVKWSIDDFGTGYSSLNLLKDLPVDIIKIDKSFLDETTSSEASKIIIKKTVELTQELEKKVVCEGVETTNQAEYLKDINCDIAQGYLYAKPMSMTNFESLLGAGN